MAALPTARKIALAARALLDGEGVEGVTLRRVAQAVGLSPMAIYRHYQDRAALLNALADEGFEELAARLAGGLRSGDLDQRLLEMADVYLDHALEHPRLFELMFLKPREGARRFPGGFEDGESPTARLMLALVREGMASGHFHQDEAGEIVLELGALSQGLIMLYLGGRIDGSAASFRQLHRRSLGRYLHGIRA